MSRGKVLLWGSVGAGILAAKPRFVSASASAASSLLVALLAAACNSPVSPPPPTEVVTVGEALVAAEWPADVCAITNSLQIQQRARIDGDVALTQASTGSVLAHAAECSLEEDAVLNGNVRADTLFLGARSSVTGTAGYNSQAGTGSVIGVRTTPLALPLSLVLPSLPTITAGTTAVTVASNQTLTKAAGAYGAVTLNQGTGGGFTKLILSGGTFHLASLTLASDARVECSSDCEIRVNGRVQVGARSFVRPASVAGMGPGNLRLLVKGSNASASPTAVPAAIGLANDARLEAYTLVPNGTLRADQRVALRGKAVARDLLLGLDSTFVGLVFPAITQHPANLTVQQGQPAVFSVAATGSGLTYQWQRNGVNISGATSATLTRTAAVADNGAQFRVVITNSAGSLTSNPAILTVTSCTASDTLCNGIDDDCDGSVDEDFVSSCGVGGGAPRITCVAGTQVSTACADANACNGTESCSAGVCQAGTAPAVDDGNVCTADACDAISGVVHTPVAAGTSCSDANACNGAETCDAAGSCTAGTAPSVDDGNPCTADSCDAVSGVLHAAVLAGTSCGDGDACNGDELCDGAGGCQAGVALMVDDGNACTADACNALLGVTHTPVAAGASCADTDVCNGAETCNGMGSCTAGTAPTVDDGNPCTLDSCDAVSGVLHAAVSAGTSCSDADTCNGAETCNAAGSCTAGTAPTVDDGNPCTADSCEALTGVTHTPLAAGTFCADTDVCNGNETCNGMGNCQTGTPLATDDGNVCTADSCDPLAGVEHLALAAGTPCPDSAMCNGEEACDGAGSCEPGLPPADCCDSSTVAYAWQSLVFDPTLVTTYAAQVVPLYSGAERSQSPMSSDAIAVDRVAVVRGRVFDELGVGLPCATVSLVNGPEIGSASTLADGSYVLAVNGGESVTLRIASEGRMTAFRAVPTQPNQDAFATDVFLQPHAPAQPVSAAATAVTVVAGEVETDADGTRSAALLVPPGTSVTVAGESTPRTSYSVQVKEVTNRAEVGRAGMLASLPPQSAFTYALSLSIEGVEDQDIQLSQPVPVYVENFLGFPNGENVPVGRYDVPSERWVAEQNGLVVRIAGLDSAGRATLDVNTTPGADSVTSLGITNAERASLASRYAIGTSLWRFPVQHFSTWDANWGAGPGPGDNKPDLPPPTPGDPLSPGNPPDDGPGPEPPPCEAVGSAIECESQVMSERVNITGTPFELVYSSRRQPGRNQELNIPLTQGAAPTNLRQIELHVQVGGKETVQYLAPGTDLSQVFSWDGRDSAGRLLYGRQRVGTVVGYTYPILISAQTGLDTTATVR